MHGSEDLLLLRQKYYSNWSTDSMQSQSKIAISCWLFLQKLRISVKNFTWRFTGQRRAKTIMKKNKVEGLHTSGFQNVPQNYSNQYIFGFYGVSFMIHC
jgi:hypothetical protein